MVYDVDIVEAAGMKCDDMVKATAARCFQRDFELMFIDSWGFHYNRMLNKACFEGTISPGKSDFAWNLKRYHGVEMVRATGIKSQDCMNFVVDQLNQGRPVGLGYDQAYLPWAKEIRKSAPLRYSGSIMITGNVPGEFCCIDIHGSHKRERLSLISFKEYADSVDDMDFDVFCKLQDTDIPDLKEHYRSNVEPYLWNKR